MSLYAILSLLMLVYMTLIFFAGTFLGLKGSDLWIFRALMALIGILGMAVYLWYFFKSVKPRRAQREKKAGGEAEKGDKETDYLIKEAESRLAESEIGGKAKVGNLPVLLVTGKAGSAKTSTLVHCGLHPELIAGQVWSDDLIAPTASANIWYAERSLFVEAGGKLLGRRTAWKRLLKKLRPRTLSAVFGARRDAPRAALVCVSCEEFLQAGSSDALAARARELRGYLEEASQVFGVRLPVYVLFTKADRIAFFTEYARALRDEETGQVVGVTVPADAAGGDGIYTERQTRLLSRYFDDLIYTLCDRRTDLLPREGDENARAGIYEFPRELRKLRQNLVQFLVDLCRPSQLRAGPFLRGFYFSGVRPVIVREAAAERPRAADRGGREIDAATMVFTTEEARRAAQEGRRAAVARKKPQWVFLSHLFKDVILADGLSSEGAGTSVKANRIRRVLLAAASLMLVFWMVALTVSFFGNRRLETEVMEAVQGIGEAEAAAGALPSVDALTRLETVRQALERLTQYRIDGPPWRLRWGLYIGNDLYPAVRRVYYSRFHQLLFADTQASLLATLQRLPDRPSPTDEYQPIYNALKAYLITTSHPDKSSPEFLTPVLMEHWVRHRDVDEERRDLAERQFAFYAADLLNSNPFSSENDTLAIERGRRYLSQFAGVERVYQYMIAEASRQNPSVNFNRMFPGSAAVVVNNREVPGAFTKNGWAFMQDALKNADRFFGGEEWVLGKQPAARIDPGQLAAQLAERYRKEFIEQWREYLRDTRVVRYRSLSDAAQKLGVLSGAQSPLLAALWLASRNTAVDSEDMKKVFQPVQYVVPPESEDRYIGDSNSAYMQALLALQSAVEQAAGAGENRDAFVAQINAQAAQAKVTTRQLAQNFRVDPQARIGPTVQQLLERPIVYAEALVRALGPAELNAKGRALCAQFRALMRKYPFRPDAAEEATLAEVAAIFQPGSGALWVFYEEDLREYLIRQGGLFAQKPGAKIRINPAFLNFFNRAAVFTEALYPAGASEPKLAFKLTGYPAEGIRRIRLTIENQTLTIGRRPASHVFVWPGNRNQRVSLTGRFGGGPELAFTSYEGLWAVFRFFGDADRWQTAGNVHKLEWILRQGRAGRPLTLPDGRPLTVRFDLEAAAPVFSKDFLASLRCVSTVAR